MTLATKDRFLLALATYIDARVLLDNADAGVRARARVASDDAVRELREVLDVLFPPPDPSLAERLEAIAKESA